MTKEEKIDELLTRGVTDIVDRSHLEAALKGKKKLRVKLGIDPTSPNIHIGRAVALWKLRAFQDLGHQVVFIVGDFTGLIGDTSDKDAERPMLLEEQIKTNLKTYFDQAFIILDKSKTEAHYNSEWLKKLGFAEIGSMANVFGLHEFEARENIAKRLKAGKRVSLRELLYPLMQGYDSVAIKADVELGGTDQRFNLLAGRTIQPLYKQAPQDIMTFDLLEGTDGRKMSSSWGNVINLVDTPDDMSWLHRYR
jgi:tyrosyl-tRNA synthetase